MAAFLSLSYLVIAGLFGFPDHTIWEQMRLNELREGFVHTMIHELRRPVQTLKVFVSFLNDREMRMDEATTERVLQDSMFELDNLSAYLDADIPALRKLIQKCMEKLVNAVHNAVIILARISWFSMVSF